MMDRAPVWLFISAVLLTTGLTTLTVGCGISASVTMKDGTATRTAHEGRTLALNSSTVERVEMFCTGTAFPYKIQFGSEEVYNGQSNFVFSGFGVERQGRYTCLCQEGGDNSLNLVVLPGFENDEFVGTAMVGDTVRLPCQLTNTHPELERSGLYTVQWISDRGDLRGRRYSKLRDNYLVIADFSEEDTKYVYQCRITRIGSDDLRGLYPHSGPRRLRLLEKPDPQILTGDINDVVSCDVASPPTRVEICLTITYFKRNEFKQCRAEEVKTTALGSINKITCTVTFYSNASSSSRNTTIEQTSPTSPTETISAELRTTLPLVIVALVAVAVLIVVLLGYFVFRRYRPQHACCTRKDEEQIATNEGTPPQGENAPAAEETDSNRPEETDSNRTERVPCRPKAIGSPAGTPNAYVVPSKTTDGSFWLYLRNPSKSWKGGRERPVSPAENIHSYQAPLQCGMKQRPTHLKCNLMRYSDHTLPSPPVTPQQTAVFPSVVVQCQGSTVGTVDRLWPRTPPQNWSSPGSRVPTPLAVAFKAQPLLHAQNSIVEEVEVFTPPPEYREVRIQKNPVAAMAQVSSNSNGDDSAMETSSSASSTQQSSPQLSPESTSAHLQLATSC